MKWIEQENRNTKDPEERIEAIAHALELLGEDLDGQQVAEVSEQLLRAHERTGLDPATTVVALVGATGSGKSSLFNALVGSDVAEVGVLRPTTREPIAVVPPGGGTTELLDWLHISRRVIRPAGNGVPPGVVLVDLPDIDSVCVEHRQMTARLAERVDMLIWVMDPQKYADDVIHTQWIRPLAAHAEVMVAVLTQADQLSVADLHMVKKDLLRLLNEDGLAHPVVVATSAVSGQGLVELRDDIATTAQVMAGKAARVHATLDDVCQQIRLDLGLEEPLPHASQQHVGERLVDVACRAGGVDRVTAAVGASYRHRAGKTTGWLALRWWHQFQADPLANLHLRSDMSEYVEESATSVTSLDQAPMTATATLNSAVRTVVTDMAAHRPARWRRRLHDVSTQALQELPDRMDRAIAQTDITMTSPRWWAVANGVQWLGWLVAVAGALWIAAVQLAGQFLLIQLPLPPWRALSVPMWMLLGGLIATLLVVFISHMATAVGWRRQVRVSEQRLRAAIGQQVENLLVRPLLAEDERQHQVVRTLDQASG